MLRWVFIDPVGFELRFDSRISAIKSIGLIPRLRKILDPPHLIFVTTLAIVLLHIVQRLRVKVQHVLEQLSSAKLSICALQSYR